MGLVPFELLRQSLSQFLWSVFGGSLCNFAARNHASVPCAVTQAYTAAPVNCTRACCCPMAL
eukprot:2108926-Amphidinium_carterae.1